MKYYFDVNVNNKTKIKVGINRPELIYGATAIITNKKIEGYAINPVTGEELPIFYRNVKIIDFLFLLTTIEITSLQLKIIYK